MDYCKRMTGFTKLFSGLVYSTVWREEMHVKVVWITMLALADRDGFVAASLPGLADAARVSLEQCEDALTRLMAPDPHSRTKLYEGRRIEVSDGGWKLLNYLKYRELRSKDERRISVRDAVARHRAKKADVSDVIESKHIAEAEADTEARSKDGTTSVVEDNPLGWRMGRSSGTSLVTVEPSPLKPTGRGWSLEEATTRIAEALALASNGHGTRLTVDRRRDLLGLYAVKYHLANAGAQRALVVQADVAKAVARLRENGDDVAELLWASDGMVASPHNQGDNDRGKKYLSASLLFRNREKVTLHADRYAGDREHPALDEIRNALKEVGL